MSLTDASASMLNFMTAAFRQVFTSIALMTCYAQQHHYHNETSHMTREDRYANHASFTLSHCILRQSGISRKQDYILPGRNPVPAGSQRNERGDRYPARYRPAGTDAHGCSRPRHYDSWR